MQINSQDEGVLTPTPTPTEIEITVQTQKCTVFDSAVKLVNKLNSHVHEHEALLTVEDTVSVIFSNEFNNRCKKLKFWTNSIGYGNKLAEE